jgi:hypothetical protein
VLFALGLRAGLAPTILPLQILKIGQFIVAGFPGEVTTMAGRRLRETLMTALSPVGKHVVLAAYANDYSQYVTTKEEYDMQHYEGASTLFGPFTLMAYQQELRKLAIALRTGAPVEPGPPPPEVSSPRLIQWRFRNRSDNDVNIKLYNTDDTARWDPLPNGNLTVYANKEMAFPEGHFGARIARAVFSGGREMTVGAGVRVTIEQNGSMSGEISTGGATGGYVGN